MAVDAYTLYLYYPQIKEIFEKNQVTQAKVFGFMNGDLDGILHALDIFISCQTEQHVSGHIERALQTLLFPHKPKMHHRIDLIDALFSPLGSKRTNPNFQTDEAQEAYLDNKIAEAIDFDEIASRGKVMGAFAALLCRELEACHLTYEVVRSRQFTQQQKTTMAHVHLYFEALQDLPRYKGYGDFFEGLESVCTHYASSRENGIMYNKIAQTFIVERNEGKKYAQELGIKASDIEQRFPLEIREEIRQIFTRNPKAIVHALKAPTQHYVFTLTPKDPNKAGWKQRLNLS